MSVNKHYTYEQLGSLENLVEHNFMGLVGKFFLGEKLGLSGCEVSLNRLPAGQGMPFVHAHKMNEELYIVLRGSGTFYVDGEEFPIREGSLIRVAPEGARAWKAGDEDLYFICVQSEVDSLSQATRKDGFHLPAKASWMQKASTEPPPIASNAAGVLYSVVSDSNRQFKSTEAGHHCPACSYRKEDMMQRYLITTFRTPQFQPSAIDDHYAFLDR